jgi:hypothetical protein
VTVPETPDTQPSTADPDDDWDLWMEEMQADPDVEWEPEGEWGVEITVPYYIPQSGSPQPKGRSTTDTPTS